MWVCGPDRAGAGSINDVRAATKPACLSAGSLSGILESLVSQLECAKKRARSGVPGVVRGSECGLRVNKPAVGNRADSIRLLTTLYLLLAADGEIRYCTARTVVRAVKACCGCLWYNLCLQIFRLP